MEEGDQHFVPVYDVNGRKIKRYRERKHPLDDWTAEEFRRRYRVTKEIVQDLSFEFGNWHTKPWSPVGGALTYTDRVSRFTN